MQEDWPTAARLGWLVVGWAAALVVLFVGRAPCPGAVRGRTSWPRAPRCTFGGYFVLLLPAFAPYLSFKVLSYGAPFLVLLALVPLAHRRAWLALAAALLVVPAAAVAIVLAERRSSTPLAAELDTASIPAGARVSVEVDDPWEQAWTLYYLRDHPLSVERPSYLLTEQGSALDAADFRHRPVQFVVRERNGKLVVEPVGQRAYPIPRSASPISSRIAGSSIAAGAVYGLAVRDPPHRPAQDLPGARLRQPLHAPPRP